MDDISSKSIAQSLSNFQAALIQQGESLTDYLKQNYVNRWISDEMYNALAIRTTFVNTMHNHLVKSGLFNIERVSLSPVTDPLAHDVEHVPSIPYKGHRYQTTHSMIYSKFLACFNSKLKGIFVDSPNIRLELESPTGQQRKKYAIDFSQMDIEVRRNRGITLEEYLNEQTKVQKILKEDFDKALNFFEDLIIAAMTAIAQSNEDNLKALDIAIEVPKKPFPRITRDEAFKRFNHKHYESEIGKTVKSQFFWVTGLLRENYDLIYPYLQPDGSKRALSSFSSDMIYNYDLCAQSLLRSGGYGTAYEIMSGAIREWLYVPIIERLLDNKIIPVMPRIKDGQIENIEELGGYGPFLLAVYQQNAQGKPLFPDTFGGGIGIERALFALTNGSKIEKVDDVMLFGKNPDSHPLYLF